MELPGVGRQGWVVDEQCTCGGVDGEDGEARGDVAKTRGAAVFRIGAWSAQECLVTDSFPRVRVAMFGHCTRRVHAACGDHFFT